MCVSSSDKTGRREIIIYLATEFNEFVTRATLITPYKMSSGNDYRSIKLDDMRISGSIEAIRDVCGGMDSPLSVETRKFGNFERREIRILFF